MSSFAIVNGESLPFADALRTVLLENPQAMQSAIEMIIIRQYARKAGITISNQEMQVAADEMRYARNLESPEVFRQWMAENLLNEASTVSFLEQTLLRTRILRGFTDQEIEAYYAEHRPEYDVAAVRSCRAETIDKAEELLELIREGTPFGAVAMQYSTDADTARAGGFVGLLKGQEVAPELQSILFGAELNVPIGPVKTKEGYNIFLIEGIVRPTLAEMEGLIRTMLYQQLLDKLQASALVEYPWAKDSEASVA
jgi:parvulin-like peptidyl-prolyl isomerase